MKREMEIIFETEEVLLFRGRRSFADFCGECNATATMLPVDAAAALFGLSERAIFRLIETTAIHFVEAEKVFVCLNSLASISKSSAYTDEL